MSAITRTLAFVLLTSAAVHAQTSGTLQGRVFDDSGAVLPAATITVSDQSVSFSRSVPTDAEGRYHVAAIPAGTYEVAAEAAGFRSAVIEELKFEVGRTLVRDFRLQVGDRSETVVVVAEAPLVDRASPVVGHVVTAQTMQEIPLNGRHFTDLGLLGPGSVAPSQTGFSTTPIRGVGALAINTAGNREEAVGFLVNGVTSNNLTFGSLMFEPPIASIQEFKIDNSVFSAEYGHVSGAIVNIVTRSGSDELHGDAHGFLRNDALDARNFFEFTSPEPHPFERHQFGGSLGGSFIRGRGYFFATYDGLRQQQGLDMNSLALSDEQRSAATDPAIRRLIELIPRANFVDADGTPRFVGAAAAVVDMDRWTIDLRQNMGRSNRLHGFYGWQRTQTTEPGSQGNTIPGFGHVQRAPRSLVPRARLNPADFGIRNGGRAPHRVTADVCRRRPQLRRAGKLPPGPERRLLRVRRHDHPPDRPTLGEIWR